MAALTSLSTVQFRVSDILGTRLKPYPQFPIRITTMSVVKPFVIEARGNTRVESPKTRNRRSRKKFTGTQTKPRLSVFCSDKQLYAMLVETLTKSVCSTLVHCRSPFAEILHVLSLKQLNGLEKSSLRLLLTSRLTRYRLMIEMEINEAKECKPLKLQLRNTGSYRSRYNS